MRQAKGRTKQANRERLAREADAFGRAAQEGTKPVAVVAPYRARMLVRQKPAKELMDKWSEERWCPETESNRRPHHYE